MSRFLRSVRGGVVTATFLVTSPAHTRVRADLYCCGADFWDSRIAMFDWKFTVRTSARAWQRFRTVCREQLLQLEVVPL